MDSGRDSVGRSSGARPLTLRKKTERNKETKSNEVMIIIKISIKKKAVNANDYDMMHLLAANNETRRRLTLKLFERSNMYTFKSMEEMKKRREEECNIKNGSGMMASKIKLQYTASKKEKRAEIEKEIKPEFRIKKKIINKLLNYFYMEVFAPIITSTGCCRVGIFAFNNG